MAGAWRVVPGACAARPGSSYYTGVGLLFQSGLTPATPGAPKGLLRSRRNQTTHKNWDCVPPVRDEVRATKHQSLGILLKLGTLLERKSYGTIIYPPHSPTHRRIKKQPLTASQRGQPYMYSSHHALHPWYPKPRCAFCCRRTAIIQSRVHYSRTACVLPCV